jgi:hypothetical protein
MRYLMLIHTPENKQATSEQGNQMMAEYGVYEQELAKAGGVKLGGAALQSVATATTVRVRNNKTQTTDGPYAETKEQLGGFYLLECKNLDDAIKWASKIPNAKDGVVEIRPVREFQQ